MLLTSAQVISFRSIEDSTTVSVDSDVTVLVGQNESGKTAFLKALYKSRPFDKGVSYDATEDYPRKKLSAYQAIAGKAPAKVLEAKYFLLDSEIKAINDALGVPILDSLEFCVTYTYDGKRSVDLGVAEEKYVSTIVRNANLPAELTAKLANCSTVSSMLEVLRSQDLNQESKAFLDRIAKFFEKTPASWKCIDYYIWSKHLEAALPKFVYFDDYYLLPGKIALGALKQRLDQMKTDQVKLTTEDQTVCALLSLAGVQVADLLTPEGYEKSRAQLEGVSNLITDKVFKFWKQNSNLEVVFDVKADPKDQPPFNAGPNLYIRIRNHQHRVTLPFNQRSKGFIWFFSFIVWFDNIQAQLVDNAPLILLLDEPGLSLHALAQKDFLDYIRELSGSHQVLYTTHSPFMIDSERLDRVRVVQDNVATGTVVSSNLVKGDQKTLFPLQAALGYTIAQNLFISSKNLLVEGPADLLYLQLFSRLVESDGGRGLDPSITIVPTGGLDKIATFISLIGANELGLCVLHDAAGRPDQRIEEVVRTKLLPPRNVLNYASYRSPVSQVGDVEDLLPVEEYLAAFNSAYKKELSGKKLVPKDLKGNDRIIARIDRWLQENGLTLRADGGFNHYRVAAEFVKATDVVEKFKDADREGIRALLHDVNDRLAG